MVEDGAIRNTIQMQREVGFKCITDGEFRKLSQVRRHTTFRYVYFVLRLVRESGTCSTMGCSITWTG